MLYKPLDYCLFELFCYWKCMLLKFLNMLLKIIAFLIRE